MATAKAPRAVSAAASKRGVTPPSAARVWLRRGVALSLLLLLAAGANLAVQRLMDPAQLPLRVIEVNGEFHHLNRDAIKQTVAGAIDGGFFSCDMHKLRVAVRAVPWVDEVSIRRVWPDTLQMTVTEQVALARWGKDALINVRGKVFQPATLDGFSEMVSLHGPQGSEQRLVDFYERIVPVARSRELTVREIELDDRRHWWVRFADGLVLSLGREDIYRRLGQFIRVYPTLLTDPTRRPERVDMRYAHGFAVSWRQTEQEQTVGTTQKEQGKV